MVFRFEIGLKLDGSLASSPRFLSSGVTCAVLNFCGNVEWLNDRLANRAMMPAKVRPHDLMSDVGIKSSGDDLEGIDFSRRRTSVSVTGLNSDMDSVDRRSDDSNG
mgnify:CR=1 FL=1